MTTTTAIIESEFVAGVVALVGRKVKGQLLTGTIGDYNVEIAGAAGTFRITVSGGPLGKWTRRQGTSKHNVASVAATLHAELNQGAEDIEEPETESATERPEAHAARTAVAAAATAQRIYGPNGIPAIKARTAAREAVYQALRAGVAERDILAAARV